MATPGREHPTPIRRGLMAVCRPTRPATCSRPPKRYPTHTPTPRKHWWRSSKGWTLSTPPSRRVLATGHRGPRRPRRRNPTGPSGSSGILDPRGNAQIVGWLTSTAGQAFIAGIDANMPPPGDGDTRTPRQHRHDALENLCREWLDNGVTPTVGGEKPQMVHHTDMSALQGIPGGLHETENGDVVDITTLRMIACDCSVTRIVFGPTSEILDVGRKTRGVEPGTTPSHHCP